MSKKIKEKVAVAIIGGTGVYDPNLLNDAEEVSVHTPYGPTSDLITIGEYCGQKVAFLPRHGAKHQLPPTKVPYRANIWALKQLGVERIIAPCAVGSLRKEYMPGQLAIVDQFVDFTKNRNYSFYEGNEVAHIAMHAPFCKEMRELAITKAKELEIDFHDSATTVTIEGPRYSTKAESIFFRDAVKADIIGMTLVPECQLARELEMCYLSVAAVTDYDAWHEEPVSGTQVVETMKHNLKSIRKLLVALIPELPAARKDCECWYALRDAMH